MGDANIDYIELLAPLSLRANCADVQNIGSLNQERRRRRMGMGSFSDHFNLTPATLKLLPVDMCCINELFVKGGVTPTHAKTHVRNLIKSKEEGIKLDSGPFQSLSL